MVMIIRFSTLFAVVVIAAKAGIFVADDASLFKNRALEPVEKKVGRLIDEAMRCRGEIEEAADGVAFMAQAIASSAVSAIVRVIWMVGRARNRAAIAAGGASVITSRIVQNWVGIMKVRDKLIRAGARNLREYGYPDASTDNILTDPVFAAFFRSMLESNLGQDDAADRITRDLIAEIDAAHPDR